MSSSPRVSLQEQVSESTTKTVLEKLLPDTRYTINVVPVYAEGDGPSLSDVGKTSEYLQEVLKQIISPPSLSGEVRKKGKPENFLGAQQSDKAVTCDQAAAV